jgi:hypothetical protein
MKTPGTRRLRRFSTWSLVGAIGVVGVSVLFVPRADEVAVVGANSSLTAGESPGLDAAHGLHQIVHIRNRLGRDVDVDDVRRIAHRAAAHGFTAVLFSSAFDDIARQPPEFFDRLTAVGATFDSLGLDVVARVTSAGYAYPTLAGDRDFAAALPVREVLFVVDGTSARHVAGAKAEIRNGGFEVSAGNRADGYRIQDGPGRCSFIDESVAREGRASMRFENLGRSRAGMGRVMQPVSVEPFRCYRMSFWVKSEDLDKNARVRGLVMGDDGRILMTRNARLEGNADWQQVTLGFNSLGYNEVRVYAGVWGGEGGRLWIDDLRIEEAGMVNLLRRDGTPVTVRGETNGIVYEEGRDYRRIVDSRLNFQMNHDGPDIELAPESRIVDGERLRVDFYQALAINGQIGACLSEDRVYELWREAIERVHATLSPRWYHLGFDEVRHGGWCVACERRHIGGAEMLGAAITRVTRMVADVDSSAGVMVWSDMLDPNHNGGESDYLFNGSFAGSWDHVPRGLVIACWHYDNRRASLRHFDLLGHRTIAAAYYDAASEEAMRENASGWLDALGEVDGGVGIIYTTWRGNYDLLEAFGDFVSGRRAPR